MLTEVRYNEDEYEFPCLLVLGSFDAIHAGHAELLKKAKLQAKINGLDLGVMVFKGGKGGNQICTYEEKLALIEQYNAKFVLSVDFTDDFKKTKPLDFLQIVEDKLNVKAYMSGKDFRFGEGAKGKSSTLKNYGEDEDNGVWYMPVKDVTDENGEKISSTKIKELIENGEITAANALLGRNYSVSCEVLSAAQNGEVTALTLVYPEGKVKIKEGVYAAKCTVAGAEYDCVASCGENFELNIKSFNGVPDGEKITVEFTDCLVGVKDVNVSPAPVEELAVADETPEEENSSVKEETQSVILNDSEETPSETVEEPVEAVSEETSVEETAEKPAVAQPEVEIFDEDGGFDDDYYEEDFLDEQPKDLVHPIEEGEPAAQQTEGENVEPVEQPAEEPATEIEEQSSPVILPEGETRQFACSETSDETDVCSQNDSEESHVEAVEEAPAEDITATNENEEPID